MSQRRETLGRGVKPPVQVPEPEDHWTNRWTFTDILLASITLFTLTAMGLGLALYLLPPDHLDLPELQPALRFAEVENFPVGGSRLVSWGDRIILVVRPAEDRFVALEGVSTADGCLLRWDRESRRVYSPCKHMEFDLNGRVVTGLATQPLARYRVYVRGQFIYVTT